jgi:hypothetical protein
MEYSRKLHNKALHNFILATKYFYGYKIMVDEMGGTCSMHETNEQYIQILVRKPEGKRPVETLWHRWEININMVLKELI